MKKMLLATVLSKLITGCSTDTLFNKLAAEPKKTTTHHFFVFKLGRRKLSMQPKFVAAQKMLLKQKPQTFVNGLSVLF